MTNSTHTPGPWAAFTDDSKYPPHTNIVAVTPRTTCVFSLQGMHKDNADVQLIAAAPELLEALEYARRFLKSEDVDTVYIDTAIAKAKGTAE